MNRQTSVMTGLLAASLAVSACARAPGASGDEPAAASGVRTEVVEQPAKPVSGTAGSVAASPSSVAMQELPTVVVHKSASCGCCGFWVDHMRAAGFKVDVRNTEDLNPIKASVGVPAGMASCHTAQVGDYFVEGHVPAADIKRLLVEQPDAKGLVLPGMPMGSPGMEVPDGRAQPYTVELVRPDGTTTAFAEH